MSNFTEYYLGIIVKDVRNGFCVIHLFIEHYSYLHRFFAVLLTSKIRHCLMFSLAQGLSCSLEHLTAVVIWPRRENC